MKKPLFRALAAFVLLYPALSPAQVPNLISQQGRVAVNGVNFDGTGQFKFALVNAAGTMAYWKNDGTTTAGTPPTTAVSLTVAKGLYTVLLGDTSLTNMAALPAGVFSNADLRLRVWFNNGTLGFQLLTPDQRLAANGYIPDASVTSAKLAPGAAAGPAAVTGATQAAAANMSYVATGGLTSFSLPATANAGDTIQLAAAGTGSWQVSGFDPDVWVPHDSDRAWRSVASSADGSKLVAAVLPGQIYTSADSGVTWTARDAVRAWVGVASSADGAKLVAVTFGGRIYTSIDSGLTWTPRDLDRNWNGVTSSADGTKLAAVVSGGQIYMSTNSGQTWTPRGVANEWSCIESSADGTKLVAAASDGFYNSTDSGVTWTKRFAIPYGWKDLAASADGVNFYAAGYLSVIWVSRDSGLTWQDLQSGGYPWTGIACSADGTSVVAVATSRDTDGRIHISSNSGSTWTQRETRHEWACVASSSDGLKLVAGESPGKLYTDNNGGFAGGPSPVPGLSGAPGFPVTLRYAGNGQWRREQVGSASIADGTVTAAKFDPSVGVWDVSGSNVFRGSGNVGIGTSDPSAPLSFGTSTADTKIALWDNGPAGVYGFGIQSYQFRIHLDHPGARFSFLDAPAGNELVTIQGTGNVGIGAPEPATRLHVRSATDTEVSVECTEPGGRRWTVQSSGSVYPPLAGSFQIIDRTAGVSRLAVMPNGNTGLSRAPTANLLEVEGNASKSTAGAWLANSDRRIKTDIQPVRNALETVDRINPVTFRYTEDYRKAHPGIADVPYYNVIAQEFREVFPNAVKSSGEKLPDGSEILQVDTYPATITALAAIKELKAENEALKQRLAALENLVLSTQSPAIIKKGAP